MDSSIKQYADSLYENALMESAAKLRQECKDYLLERSQTQDARQLFSGSDFQNQVRIYADHIERCTAARLDSYRTAYAEINRLPTEGELAEILDDFKATWEIQIRHSDQSLRRFLAGRNAPLALDVSGNLRATSAHGHDRVLREWKIWGDRVKLQRSTATPATVAQSNAPASYAIPLPEEAESRVLAPESNEDQAQQGIRRVSHLSGHGLIALFVAFILGALAVSGITSTNIGHLLWFLAWMAGSIFIFAEVLPSKSLRYKLLVCGVLGVLITAGDLWTLRSKGQQDSGAQHTQEVPGGPRTRPTTKGIDHGSQPPTETHGTSDSLETKVQRHGTTDAVTAKVGHGQGVLRLTFQDSPAFTPARTERISGVLNDYYNYLTSEVGLELPKELPPIGLSPKGGPTLVGGQPGAPPYYSRIIISEDSIDSGDAVRSAYSMYAFQESIRTSPANVSPQEFSGEALWVFTCHFASSFSGKKVCSNDLPASKWIDTVWEIRQDYGKSYADKVMGFTLRMWPTSSPGQWKIFDQFFMNKLMSGEVVMNGDPGRFNKVREIAKRHGVQIE